MLLFMGRCCLLLFSPEHTVSRGQQPVWTNHRGSTHVTPPPMQRDNPRPRPLRRISPAHHPELTWKINIHQSRSGNKEVRDQMDRLPGSAVLSSDWSLSLVLVTCRTPHAETQTVYLILCFTSKCLKVQADRCSRWLSQFRETTSCLLQVSLSNTQKHNNIFDLLNVQSAGVSKHTET